MPRSLRTTQDIARARKELDRLRAAPVTLTRPVYFVPGWRDEQGACWARMEQWIPLVVANYRTHVSFVEFVGPGGEPLPPWEDFLDFGDDLAELVHKDVAGTGGAVDLVCHSMGGLDAVTSVALLDGRPGLPTPHLDCVHTVITYDTPFLGFGAAKNPLLQAFVKAGRQDPFVLSQLAAMEKDSKHIAEVVSARDVFLERITEFWPRGADNFDGILEVPNESASFGEPADFAANLRPRYRTYESWADTAHSGPQNGVTHDLRAVLETVQILCGLKA